MTRIKTIARKLCKDWYDKAPYMALSGDFAIETVDQAYEAQLELQRLYSRNRGSVVGRKIALSSRAMQEMVGIDHPIAGAFFSHDLHHSPAKIRLDNFQHLGLEFELALELKTDVLPQDKPHTPKTVRGLVASARPAFELIEDRSADYSDLDPLTLIADNAWCGGVVLGQEIDNWENRDPGDIASLVHQDGEPVELANTGAADPLGSLAWVLDHFSGRGMALSKGEYVITGSAVRTRFPIVGDKFTYEVAGATASIEIC